MRRYLKNAFYSNIPILVHAFIDGMNVLHRLHLYIQYFFFELNVLSLRRRLHYYWNYIRAIFVIWTEYPRGATHYCNKFYIVSRLCEGCTYRRINDFTEIIILYYSRSPLSRNILSDHNLSSIESAINL